MKKFFNRIWDIGDIVLIIGFIILSVLFIQEIILNNKVIQQENCVELNSIYYCEVEK